MKRFTLAILLLAGCASARSYNYDLEREESEYSLEYLKGAVCKVTLPGGGHGSGFAFKRDKEHTYILTAGHIVWGNSDDAGYVLSYKKKGKDRIEIADTARASKEYDLAVLTLKNSNMNILSLEKRDWEPKNFSERLVLAVGYPNRIYPPNVSIGVIESVDNLYYNHTACIFFGNSGGPLVRFSNGKAIGVNVLLMQKGGIPQSDTGMAVNLECIYKFLEE